MMFEVLWGLKTVAAFDVWTIEHILSGVSVGHAVKKDNHKHIKKHNNGAKLSWNTRLRFDLVAILFLAYFWETAEHYMETGWLGDAVAYWFQGVEFWPNRLLTDPLMLVLGYLIAKKYPVLVWPARAFSLAWILVHVFIFPHSMYLHYLF